MEDGSITNAKAKILYRYMTCVVECPYCGEELIIQMDESLGADITTVECPSCSLYSTINTFEFLSQIN